MKQIAGWQDVVTIHYTARTRDGGIVEDTTPRKPLTLPLDDDQYLPALRNELIGMSPGETKVLSLPAESVFGQRNHRMQMSVPLTALPSGIQEGEQLSVEIEGSPLDVWIIQVANGEAILDTNHPLAGESVEFTVKLISIDQ